MPKFAVILPAAGSSTRFGGGRNKLQQLLAGKTVLARSIQAFHSRTDVATIVMPVHTPGILSPENVTICQGGGCRAESVYRALQQTPADIEWIAIHDAARPLVSPALIDITFAAALKYGAAAPALPISLTIKQAIAPLPSKVQRTIARHELWAMQTPQIARRTDLLEAFERCPLPLDQVTDDLQLLELQGKEVWLVPGEERNLKITTALDLKLAELILTEAGEQ
ncbi:MAG TPA: IspD/TarI family cytidylyltransferase [Tepidisphaeraceae bacterium]|jgi:2-C-methyl-D-erythritol 4-phosphate cytidylyltransferase|nr:IspD/TarI family cytidylyltransferase [Tepidisphaeraceae bacterium]